MQEVIYFVEFGKPKPLFCSEKKFRLKCDYHFSKKIVRLLVSTITLCSVFAGRSIMSLNYT